MTGVFVSLAISMGLVPAAPPEGHWIDDYGTVLAAAQTSSKPLLVVIDKPGDPQTRFQQVSAKLDVSQAALLANYHLCHVDASSPYGKRIAQAFNVSELPLTVITDRSARRILFKQTGVISNSQWSTTLSKYRYGS